MPRTFIQLLSFFLFIGLLSANDENNIHLDILSKQAQKEHKYLLVYFHKFGCSFCEKMQDRTLDNKDVAAVISKKFLLVDIGIDDEGTVKYKDFSGSKHDFAKSLEINFYPTVGFMDGNNSIVYGVVGYRDKSVFEIILKYIYTGAYKEMDLEEFKAELEFESDE